GRIFGVTMQAIIKADHEIMSVVLPLFVVTMSTNARDIPAIKKADGPTDYSTTPSGTMYYNTPGGTRRIYDRDTLLNLANSPLAKTPPSNLAYIPGVTIKPSSGVVNQVSGHLAPPQSKTDPKQQHDLSTGAESDEETTPEHKESHNDGLFDMDLE
ncbi:729_t:CDS:2, partial [Diversispora eburnea]